MEERLYVYSCLAFSYNYVNILRYRLDADNCNVNCNYYVNYPMILSELFACNRKNMILE